MKKISILFLLIVMVTLFFLNPFLAILVALVAGFFLRKGGQKNK